MQEVKMDRDLEQGVRDEASSNADDEIFFECEENETVEVRFQETSSCPN
jgi:hypothetical protein